MSCRRTSLSSRSPSAWIAASLLALGWAGTAGAATVDIAFEGAGNVVVFDAAAGTGGWVGTIDQLLLPSAPGPAAAFASVVTFTLDALTGQLAGEFTFTRAIDLGASVFGTVSGAFTTPVDQLDVGGQLALDYTVTGGSGDWLGARGFGLSFLTYELASSSFNNYSEQGLLSLQVPAPSTPLLAAAALAWLALTRKAAPRPLN